MLGGHQRTDEVEWGGGERLESFLTIVAFIKYHGDVVATLGQMAVVASQLLGDGTELGAVGDVAGVNLVQ